MSAHTPGPWGAWQPLNDGSWAVTAWEAGDKSAKPGDPARLPPRIADEIDVAADARLIAAAPELLAACRVCLEAERRRAADLQPRSPASAYTQDRIARIEAAIAKAVKP